MSWKVCYGSGYWGSKADGQAVEEMMLNCRFTWNDENWYIPAVYLCEEGIVVEFCIKIDPTKVEQWINRWQIGSFNENEINQDHWEEIEKTNPLEIKFNSKLSVNREVLLPKTGSGLSWIPPKYLSSDVKNVEEAEAVLQHYGLDASAAWSLHRWSYPWKEAKLKRIQSMDLKLERGYEEIEGIRFEDPKEGDVISFVHPISKQEHRLIILENCQNEVSINKLSEVEYEFPKKNRILTYIVEPELSDLCFQIKDCVSNDEPKRKAGSKDGAHSIGIIGGADGPTAVALVSEGDIQIHRALSALHFDWVEQIQWKMVFQAKRMKDVKIQLL